MKDDAHLPNRRFCQRGFRIEQCLNGAGRNFIKPHPFEMRNQVIFDEVQIGTLRGLAQLRLLIQLKPLFDRKVYDTVCEEAKSHNNAIAKVRKWFNATFPNYGKLPEFDKENRIVVTPEGHDAASLKEENAA